MLEKFLAFWCRTMHDSVMWPVQGKYICSQCLRQYSVGWETRTTVTIPVRAPRPIPAPSASMDICA